MKKYITKRQLLKQSSNLGVPSLILKVTLE